MKSRQWIRGLAVCFFMTGVASVHAANYYINDAYVPGADIYTTAAGNRREFRHHPMRPRPRWAV
jgi:hypothetical protein